MSGRAELAAAPSSRDLTVALVGPPNCGKSTLFNLLTGLRQRVANYPGITVEKRIGRTRVGKGEFVWLVDLPGIHGGEPRSVDERITWDILTGKVAGEPAPDAIVLVLDSTNLERQLSMSAPVLALKTPKLVVLNMSDELARRAGWADPSALSRELGVPVALVSATQRQGIEKVLEFLAHRITRRELPESEELRLPVLQDVPARRSWAARVGAEPRYRSPLPPLWTHRLDSLFLHPVLGPLVFIAVVLVIFQSIFTLAIPIMDGLEGMVARSGAWLGAMMPDNWVRSLVVDGLWGGVGSVLVFLPQILILFFFIGLIEDSGYVARAALIADRTMRRVGLQGKSFLPLMSSYACAVPAILATRTIESRRDRLATIFIAPFMTCSARLPVYTLLIAAFVPERALLGPFLGTRATAMLGLYGLGLAAAVVTAALLRSTVLKPTATPFVLEMPPYRLPTLRSIALRLVDRCKIFLRRAGTIILGVTLVLWLMTQLPLVNGGPPPLEQSVAGRLGQAMEPAIAPLGFNWKIGVGLISSLAAREVIVSTLGTIYGLEESDEVSPELQARLREDLTPAASAALLVFFVFALQCVSTVAVVRRETGGWGWPAAQFAYMTLLAYVGAFVTHALLS